LLTKLRMDAERTRVGRFTGLCKPSAPASVSVV